MVFTLTVDFPKRWQSERDDALFFVVVVFVCRFSELSPRLNSKFISLSLGGLASFQHVEKARIGTNQPT